MAGVDWRDSALTRLGLGYWKEAVMAVDIELEYCVT
jgi:hypothetical protein